MFEDLSSYSSLTDVPTTNHHSREASDEDRDLLEESLLDHNKEHSLLSICAKTRYSNGREQAKIFRHIIPSLL